MGEQAQEPGRLEAPSCEIGASPIWDGEAGCLLFVDVMAGLVHRHRFGAGETETFRMPSSVGCVVPSTDGHYVLGLEDGYWLADPTFGVMRRLGAFHRAADGIRMNAGKADGHGRFWAGTMAYDLRPRAGVLGVLDRRGKIEVHLEGLGEANGMGWSPDGRTFYLVDSGVGVVDAFDFDVDVPNISRRRTIVRIPKEDGLTDGMTVDAEGFIWLSLWGGWSVRRYASDGRLDRVIDLPVSQVTGCTFGGTGLEDLIITTAAYQLAPDDAAAQPLAGSTFVVRPGCRGLPAGRFELDESHVPSQ